MTNSFLDLAALLGGADYWPVRSKVVQFIPVVSQLAACRLGTSEIDQFARAIRATFHANRPQLTAFGTVSFLVPTVWREIATGRKICVRIQLERLGSIRVPGATTKVTAFELRDPSGELLGTVRSLPFVIENLSNLSYQLRAVLGARFSPETFGARLYSAYVEAGAPIDLPVRLPLCDMPDGRLVELRLEPADASDARNAKAGLIVDDLAVEVGDMLPEILKRISSDALDIASFECLAEMLGTDENASDDLRYRVFQRFEYAARRKPILVRELALAGENVLLFSTGEKSADGHRIFCLAREMGEDGKYTSVCWVRSADLVAFGLSEDLLPGDVDFGGDFALALDGNLPLSTPEILHILKRASRWADADVFGREGKMIDQFDDWYKRGLRSALDRKTPFAFGVYCAKDRGTVGASVHPIQAMAPLVDAVGRVRAAFVVRRVVRNGEARLEVPTVLTLAQARRSASVAMGSDIPDWLKNAA